MVTGVWDEYFLSDFFGYFLNHKIISIINAADNFHAH